MIIKQKVDKNLKNRKIKKKIIYNFLTFFIFKFWMSSKIHVQLSWYYFNKNYSMFKYN